MKNSSKKSFLTLASLCLALAMGGSVLGCGNGNTEVSSAQDTATKTPAKAPVEAKKVEPKAAAPVAPVAPVAAAAKEYKVTNEVEFTTSLGSFTVALYGEDAPKTVANFLSYVDKGFYNGTIFHRVIPGFMIQGGGFNAKIEKAKTDAPIKLEIIPGLKHEPGVLSMARTSDPHSATAQFFVCVASPRQLNGGYAAFGKVTKGYDIVEAISKVKTGVKTTPMGPMRDVPDETVAIVSAKRL